MRGEAAKACGRNKRSAIPQLKKKIGKRPPRYRVGDAVHPAAAEMALEGRNHLPCRIVMDPRRGDIITEAREIALQGRDHGPRHALA